MCGRRCQQRRWNRLRILEANKRAHRGQTASKVVPLKGKVEGKLFEGRMGMEPIRKDVPWRDGIRTTIQCTHFPIHRISIGLNASVRIGASHRGMVRQNNNFFAPVGQIQDGDG